MSSLMNDSILAELRTLTATPESPEELSSICASAFDSVFSMLRDGADSTDPRIISAAAGIAFHTLAVRRASADGDVTSFKAGDVSIGRSPSVSTELAAAVRDERLAAAAELIRDCGFDFRAVGA